MLFKNNFNYYWLYIFNFFNNNTNTPWEMSWILLAAGTSLNLFISLIIAFLHIISKIKEVDQYQLIGQLFD